MESAPARAQSRILPFRLSKTVQPARDKGCGTQSPDTHNAACGIETSRLLALILLDEVPTHIMPRAALKPKCFHDRAFLPDSPDTHNAACGINNKMALRVLSVTQSRFRMRKAHSNLDDAAHRC